MGSTTSISWTDATWTPVRARVKADALEIAEAKGYTSLLPIIQPGRVGPHCEHVSPGCENCYSETNNGRCLTYNGTGLPFDRRARDLVDIFLDEKLLAQPFHWKKPRRVFVCSQTDLFGEFVPDEMIDRVFAVMALCPQHTFQVLTKRSVRLRGWTSSLHAPSGINRRDYVAQYMPIYHGMDTPWPDWPLPNVWLGVSVEDQETADERIPLLLQTPAAMRFVSYEPALGPVELRRRYLGGPDEEGACIRCGCEWQEEGCTDRHECPPGFGQRLSWVIIGGESGRDARPFNIAWARKTIADCRAAGIACFVKQLGAAPVDWRHDVPEAPPYEFILSDRKGGNWSEWPADLRVRQFPEVRR